jgi:hypothetical protein
VAILGLAGRHHHWTVAYQVSDRQMRLQDSGKLKVLLRSRCTSAAADRRYVLSPESIILLRRSGTNASDHDDASDHCGPCECFHSPS